MNGVWFDNRIPCRAVSILPVAVNKHLLFPPPPAAPDVLPFGAVLCNGMYILLNTKYFTRAIENRREIVRAANSGVSAHINALGEVVEDTFYNEKTALPVKAKLLEDLTPYTQMGDLVYRMAIFVLGFLLMYHFGDKIASKKYSKKI